MVDLRDALFESIYEYARSDEKVIFLTADADAFVLKKFRNDFPNRFINIGVAEQNAVLVATGLAMAGFKPYVYSITPFITARCYEQIKVNVCSMNLPITLIGLGAGFSFSFDGPTHHAISDIAIMRTLPEMTILNTSDVNTVKECSRLSYESKTPSYIRLDKGIFPIIGKEFQNGFRVLKHLSKMNMISTGTIIHSVYELAGKLCLGLVDMYQLKPFNEKFLSEIIHISDKIIVVEENVINGAVCTIVLEHMAKMGVNKPLIRIALEDKQYFDYADQQWIRSKYGLTPESIEQRLCS